MDQYIRWKLAKKIGKTILLYLSISLDYREVVKKKNSNIFRDIIPKNDIIMWILVMEDNISKYIKFLNLSTSLKSKNLVSRILGHWNWGRRWGRRSTSGAVWASWYQTCRLHISLFLILHHILSTLQHNSVLELKHKSHCMYIFGFYFSPHPHSLLLSCKAIVM